MDTESYRPLSWAEMVKEAKRANQAQQRSKQRKRSIFPKPIPLDSGVVPVDLAKTTKITLRAQHLVDGHAYGPGIVIVPQHLMAQLLHQDQAAVAYDESFMSAKNGHSRGVVVTGRQRGFGGHVVPVHMLESDAPLPEIGSVSGASLDFSTFKTL